MERYIIPSVFQAIQLCQTLASSKDGLRAADIEHALQVPRTTVFRLLKTLLSERVVEKRGTRYVYGRRIYEVNAADVNRRTAQNKLTQPLARLIDGHSCSALISIPSETGALTVDVIDSSASYLCPIRAGTQLSLFKSAPGQIALAYYPQLLERQPEENSPLNNDLNQASASKCRSEACTRGYAVTYCSKRQSTLIAVPAFSANGELTAILSLYFPSILKNTEQLYQWSNKLKSISRIPSDSSVQSTREAI